MNKCLFCGSDGPFQTKEHIIPESLGNDDLILYGEVCDSCQNYFGKEVENYVLSKTPIGFWRTFLGIQTKKGKNPSVDLSQPKNKKGRIPAFHPMHEDVGYSYHNDGSVSIDIDNSDLINNIINKNNDQITFVMTPKVLHMLGRFLCKIGVELICSEDKDLAKSEVLRKAKDYARYGTFDGLWPVFHFSKGEIKNLKRYRFEDDLIEEVDFYSFSLADYNQHYLLFRFTMGTDNWIICLNDPYPHTGIRSVFPNENLNLIWYDKDEWKR